MMAACLRVSVFLLTFSGFCLSCSSIIFCPLCFAGNMLYILDNAESETEYPDIRLWRQAHEPVIARDAFSSFMWILFCLPWPMLSCKESYLSLVHVFYVVSVTQVHDVPF